MVHLMLVIAGQDVNKKTSTAAYHHCVGE